jgi:hypothetical protein
MAVWEQGVIYLYWMKWVGNDFVAVPSVYGSLKITIMAAVDVQSHPICFGPVQVK